MDTISQPDSFSSTLRSFPTRLFHTNRGLGWSVVIYLLLFGGTLVASVVDTRLITGAPAWFKPLKFLISTILYCGTLAWMLSFVEGRQRWVRLIGGLTAFSLFVEITIILLQAARGVRSHFNVMTPLDNTLYSIMGGFIMMVWVMNLLTAVLLLRQRLPNPALAWSLRLGLLVTLVGAALGMLMARPTPAQVAGSGQTQFWGAHSVGVEDGGPGLPFTGWSTEGGDIRVAHFVGLHALQMIPFLGWLIERKWRYRWSQPRQAVLVWVAGLGYLGLVLLLLWQALRGQPLIAPDGTTVAALVGLVSLVAAATTAVWVTAPSTPVLNGRSPLINPKTMRS